MLSTPPAFILSQDQTLNKLYLNGLSRSNQVIEVSFLNFKDNELTSSLSYCVTSFLKDSIMSFWCFVCFSSLFNLQGTNRSQSAELYYSTAALVCQAFSFSEFAVIRSSASHANSFSLSHLRAFVNTFFQIFFRAN